MGSRWNFMSQKEISPKIKNEEGGAIEEGAGSEAQV